MRLNKGELAAKLTVSEKSLTNWQREGMPVLEHGRRGQPSSYDLAAVLRWIRRTRDPLRLLHVPIAALEREAGLVPATVADVWTEVHRHALSRALALARIDWLEDARAYGLLDGDPFDASELAGLVESFIAFLARRLAAADAGAGQACSAVLIGREDRARSLEEAIDWAAAVIPGFQPARGGASTGGT